MVSHIVIQMNKFVEYIKHENTDKFILELFSEYSVISDIHILLLYEAVKCGNVEICKFLLSIGVDVNKGFKGISYILLALLYGNDDCVSFLIHFVGTNRIINSRKNVIIYVMINQPVDSKYRIFIVRDGYKVIKIRN
jgi:hypothetical protein